MNARTEAEAEAPRWQDEVYDTSLGVDLERIAAGSGIKRTPVEMADLADRARLLREGNGTAFVLLRVKPSEPPSFKRDLDPALPGTLQNGIGLGELEGCCSLGQGVARALARAKWRQ